ncbi:MAG TPA: hypothetical protein VME47_14880, partial [Acetobacteraceae bacterium]|nr:hypothetical protein [Acetobacteraceae bacterium]
EDDRYGLFYHAWVKAGEMTPEQVLRRETRRIPLLLRKFKEDLAAGHKLFVFKGSLPPDEVYPLLPALRQYGPNRLLYVCPADAAHPPGTVEWAAPDFLVGYVDRFAPEENAHDLSLDSWLAVCRAADGLAWPDLGEATAPKPAGQIATPPVLRRAPQPVLSTRLGFRLQSGNFVDSGGAGQGFAALHQLETPPHWVRLLFANDRTTPLHVDGAAVAATSASDDDVTPINALGEADMALWQRVTFDAGGRDVDPLDAVGSDTWRIELPANAGPQRQPQRAASDWVPLPGLARNDQGAGALLLVRSFSSGLQRYSGAAGQPDPAIGHRHVSFWCPGNPTAPPWNAEWRPFTSLFPSHGLQYIGTVPGATVVGIGSHTLHAIHSDGGLSGFALRACAMVSRPNLPVSWFNETQTGGSSADYAVGGAWAIRTLRPQIVLIESWCEYDLHLGIDAALCFARAMALADMARRAGGVPVLITPAPVFADNQAGERWRQANLAQAREAGRLGVPVLDLDALWGTGAWPNAFRPEFDRGNHRHQNRAGDLLAAEALANLLAGILCT